MSARRLKVQGSGADAPRAIPGVPAPLRTAGRAYSLVQVLEIVLDTAGLRLGYEIVMGICGLAYRTPPWPEEPKPSPEESLSAVKALGSALSGGISVVGDEGAPPAEALMEQVQQALETGRPCAALGWGSVKEEWSVICGCDTGRGRLLGHCLLDQPREQYESWPPDLELLVTLPAAPEPSGRKAIERALRCGYERLFAEARPRYGAWAQKLREMDEPPSARHEQAVEMLADARSAAASFAEEVALHEEEVPAAWLTEAAGLWHQLVDLLEARGAPFTPEAMKRLDTPEGREAWVRTLERAAHLDDRAARAVKCSTTADYLPQETLRS